MSATLLKMIAVSVSKSLLNKMPSAAADKFNIDEEEFKLFLQGFLANEMKLGKATGTKRSPSAYTLFSKATRDGVKKKNPDITFGEMSKVLGQKWKRKPLTNSTYHLPYCFKSSPV